MISKSHSSQVPKVGNPGLSINVVKKITCKLLFNTYATSGHVELAVVMVTVNSRAHTPGQRSQKHVGCRFWWVWWWTRETRGEFIVCLWVSQTSLLCCKQLRWLKLTLALAGYRLWSALPCPRRSMTAGGTEPERGTEPGEPSCPTGTCIRAGTRAAGGTDR